MAKRFKPEERDFFEELVYSGFEPRGEETETDEDGVLRRYTQDSPVMPDVWIFYGLEPHKRHDLLLTPWKDRSPGKLKNMLTNYLKQDADSSYQKLVRENMAEAGIDYGKPEIAYNQTTVVAKLWFHELVRVVLPLTTWWVEQVGNEHKPSDHPTLLLKDRREELRSQLMDALESAAYDWDSGIVTPNLTWLARIAGTIALAADPARRGKMPAVDELKQRSRSKTELAKALLGPEPPKTKKRRKKEPDHVGLLVGIPGPDEIKDEDGAPSQPLFNVNRNRDTVTAMYRSVPTIKADAAQKLFGVKGRNITWAILDSGIDATHLAFRVRDVEGKITVKGKADAFLSAVKKEYNTDKWDEYSRVVKTYDFTNVRELLSDDNDKIDLDVKEEFLRSLEKGRMIEWEMLESSLRVDHDETYIKENIPESNHGTHVAGILGADWRSEDDLKDVLPPSNLRDDKPAFRTGVCPEINIYDLRVVGANGRGNEFSVMAALQFVRSLNARRDYVEIHGVNISLSLEHEVSNYACGRTPVCNECERLVGAGIVVVASAGNSGRQRFLTQEGSDKETYSSISITDPGNAESIITVGSTHSREPHTYGVSYFSSRGPTGDGRLKPDLVAPGEKICSTIPKNREEFLDGTSMAAPHVSGAAALLMSRHPELIGDPQRIKRILCDTATDLGRERYFQGAGLLDTLRALQHI